jgi:hypothetical protein
MKDPDAPPLGAQAMPAPAAPATPIRLSLGRSLRFGHDVLSMCSQCLRTIPGKVTTGDG